MAETLNPTTGEVITAPTVTDNQLDLVRRTVAADATPAELDLYLYDCARRNVHPLDRLIHFTKRGGKYTPVTSIDFMRSRASDSGEYAGNDDAVFAESGGMYPSAARVVVYRLVQGQRCEFSATARWAEYYPGDGGAGTMWRKMPHTMLGKCAEALALRKAFPAQLSGLYTGDEMDQAARDQGGAERSLEPQEADPPPRRATGGRKITAKQAKRLWAIAFSAETDTDALTAYLLRQGWQTTTDIPLSEYDGLCQKLEAGTLDLSAEPEFTTTDELAEDIASAFESRG